MVYTVIVSIILILVLPLAIGRLTEKMAGVSYSDWIADICFSYVMGQVVLWALFQLAAVPLIFAKKTLTVLTVVWVLLCAVTMLVMAYGVGRKGKAGWLPDLRERADARGESAPWLFLSVVMAVLLVGYQCYKYVVYMHLDEDDSRFVVTAVDAYETDMMYLINPATGEYMGTWVGELLKDVSSPWTMYIALLAKLTHIYPTVIAHTVYPAFLLAMGYMAYYLIGNLLTDGNRTKSFLCVAAAAGINMTFGQSGYNQSYFSLVRIWQGKAVVAGVMIPFLTYMLMRLYRESAHISGYILLVPAAMATCLMSGMGIFFSGIMIGVYGVWFTLITKKWKRLPLILLACMPTVIYGLTYATIK